jgi:hypothetical protein
MTKTKKERERLREQLFLDSYNGLSPHLMALYGPDTMDNLGKLLSVILGWNGLKILELCAVALTNANFHDAAAAVWHLHDQEVERQRGGQKEP